LINEALVKEKFVLIRRSQTFTLVDASETIEKHLVPLIDIRDLDNYGNTELIQTVLELETLNVEDFASEVKQLKGPFGEVTAMPRRPSRWRTCPRFGCTTSPSMSGPTPCSSTARPRRSPRPRRF